MKFTGERFVPGEQGLEELYVEHMSRYVFASDIASGGRVLDVGCGCGYGTHYMALRGADSVIGIDTSEEAVDFAASRYRHPGLRFAVMDACRLGLKAPFSLITCFEVIEHVEDAPALLGQVRHVLGDAGVFLVSTPNKRTYTAGGPGGTNPFHFREYYREEFEDLLKSAFPHVLVFGQDWAEGMALSLYPPEREQPPYRAMVLPDESGTAPLRFKQGEPPYFIAACAVEDIPGAITDRVTALVMHPLETRYDRLKAAMVVLRDEFDSRGRWAHSLTREVEAKDDEIRRLQAEVESLRAGFDERGRWAQQLNQELADLRVNMAKLVQENATLRSRRQPAGGLSSPKEIKWSGQ